MRQISGGEAKVLGLSRVGSKSSLDQKLRQEREEAKVTSKAALKREIELYKKFVSFT